MKDMFDYDEVHQPIPAPMDLKEIEKRCLPHHNPREKFVRIRTRDLRILLDSAKRLEQIREAANNVPSQWICGETRKDYQKAIHEVLYILEGK